MRKPPNFDHLAGMYHWMETATFGPSLDRCRTNFLGELHASRNALIIGDGDGRFTATLLDHNPVVLVDALDSSAAMLQALIRNAGIRSSRIRIHHADARLWEPLIPTFDLIVTHFFLDCLTTKEVTALAKGLRAATTPNAKWVLSEFAIPRGWFGRLVAWPLVTMLYVAFFLLTGMSVFRLPNYRKALEGSGFVLSRERKWMGGILVSQLWIIRPPEEAPRPLRHAEELMQAS